MRKWFWFYSGVALWLAESKWLWFIHWDRIQVLLIRISNRQCIRFVSTSSWTRFKNIALTQKQIFLWNTRTRSILRNPTVIMKPAIHLSVLTGQLPGRWPAITPPVLQANIVSSLERSLLTEFAFNALRRRQNNRRFADNIFVCIFGRSINWPHLYRLHVKIWKLTFLGSANS